MRVTRYGTLAATALLVALATIAAPAAAQRGGGPPGGGPRNGPRGASTSSAMGERVAKEMEGMAMLKPLLKGISLTHAQKDSLGALEKLYKDRFHGYGTVAKEAFPPTGAPDYPAIRRLRVDAVALREEEWRTARAQLTAAQAATFDANAAKVRTADEERSRSDARSRS